ncbi:hypothetical protein [Microvirga tunisiensis]|uniref:Uncharacterized protein n=1 Tax=Microvirga tunisiensis TaxID=2108360 RepID=A0A5N7MJ60_9HYPH|nr:hypothetical protein [Microvirga tunisiensis]MPR07809.1 hypothetical protein [Microvirga tunisiensis]MPR26204.1 hypothetical protein [Microvirga tunisiensis]
MADLGESDAGRLMQLYKVLATKGGTEGKALADMTEEELRRYKTESKRRSRERQRLAAKCGSPEPTTDNVRNALADAALMILAANAPGSAEIKKILSMVFAGRPGVPGKVQADACKGKIKPRMIVVHPPADEAP